MGSRHATGARPLCPHDRDLSEAFIETIAASVAVVGVISWGRYCEKSNNMC